MAYMNQAKKAALAPHIKAILKKYGMKGSISVENHSTLVVTLKSGPLDIIKNFNDVAKCKLSNTGLNKAAEGHIQVNKYWIKENYTGTIQEFLVELNDAMNIGNHDRSEIQIDYFDVGWWTEINVGKWNKAYEVTK